MGKAPKLIPGPTQSSVQLLLTIFFLAVRQLERGDNWSPMCNAGFSVQCNRVCDSAVLVFHNEVSAMISVKSYGRITLRIN